MILRWTELFLTDDHLENKGQMSGPKSTFFDYKSAYCQELLDESSLGVRLDMSNQQVTKSPIVKI